MTDDLPLLSPEETIQLGKVAARYTTLSPIQRMKVLHLILMENVRLMKEINQLREKLGLPLRIVFDPMTGKPVEGNHGTI